MAATSGYAAQDAKRAAHEERVTGWWMFAGFMLGLSGTLDLIWGIAAIANASFFVNGQHYIASDNLHVWGWVTVILGTVKVIAAGSLFAGGGFGRWVGIFAACLAAIVALITLPAYPFWGICSFALAVIIVYELAKPAPA
jgi:hypothetical protein